MNAYFEELDYQPTELGALSLRRRWEPKLEADVFEVKLGDDFLMSSLFTVSEIALARLGLAALSETAPDVLVGGLGLGFTPKAVLEDRAVQSLTVIELFAPVIDWHERGILPLGPVLTADPRCRFVQGDFFALAASNQGVDPAHPGRRFHAILLDIDHGPDDLLDADNGSFYGVDGLRQMASHLHPGGVFGLWSNAPPEDGFTDRLAAVFREAWAEPVTFHNPLQNRPFTQTVYLARK